MGKGRTGAVQISFSKIRGTICVTAGATGETGINGGGEWIPVGQVYTDDKRSVGPNEGGANATVPRATSWDSAELYLKPNR